MRIKNFLKSEQKTVGKATAIIAVFIVLSRFLGLIRDRLLASSFGASAELDIYFASFKIPDLVFSVVLAGGVLVSLLPLFSDYYKKNKEEAFKLINSVINIFAILLTFIAFFFFIFTSQIVNLILPGIDPIYMGEAINLTRLLFLAVFFLGLSSIFSTILNYFNRFVVYSLAPILYNVGIILGIIFLVPFIGIYGPAIGVVIGSFFHFLVQFLASLKYGYKYKLGFNLHFKGVQDFFKLLFPRIISASAGQVNLLVITAIASTIAVGAISFFNLANNLRFLPVGFLGISFATAVFPHLSKSVSDHNMKVFSNDFRTVLQDILYLALPISILTFIMRDLIVSIILQTGQFQVEAVEITGACLGIFALSMVFQCLEPTLLRAYFSLKDTKTPAIISIVFLLINAFLSIGFVEFLKTNETVNSFILNLFHLNSPEHVLLLGLVFAFNVSLIIDFVLLFVFLKKKLNGFNFKKLKSFLIKISLSSFVMVFVTLFTLSLFKTTNSFWMNLLEFSAVTIVSFFFYFLFTFVLKTEGVSIFKGFLMKGLDKMVE